MLLIILLATINLLFSPDAQALKWSGTPSAAVKEYTRFQKRFRKAVCAEGDEEKFTELRKAYHEFGFYVPSVSGKVDSKTIREGLDLIEAKIAWIAGKKEELSKARRFVASGKEFRDLRKQLEISLDYKKMHRLVAVRKMAGIFEKADLQRKDLVAAYDRWVNRHSFLTNFQYPVDHLDNRKQHEKLKKDKSAAGVQASNAFYFKRKILEDGSFNEEHTRSDMMFRTTLDTIKVNLGNSQGFVTEDERSDLRWAMNRALRLLSQGRRYWVKRLGRWEDRMRDMLAFYRSLLDGTKAEEYRSKKSKASAALRQFVYNKQAEAYKYLASQPEMMRAFYVIEQILLHEVGPANNDNYRDRGDVLQVVLYRFNHPFYSSIGNGFRGYLERAGVNATTMTKSKWLNVMFRRGEFSFTYYYMRGSVGVFCTDQSKRGISSRNKNIWLAAGTLGKPLRFNALRYFSRISMTGRIDMSEIWRPEYEPIPERPGRMRKHDVYLKKSLNSGRYDYLYDFRAEGGARYDVIRIGNELFSVRGFPRRPKFYNYRDRHRFRYFRKNI